MEDPSILFTSWFKTFQAASRTKEVDAPNADAVTTSLKVLIPVRPRIHIYMWI
jgi:hypothetical protein